MKQENIKDKLDSKQFFLENNAFFEALCKKSDTYAKLYNFDFQVIVKENFE